MTTTNWLHLDELRESWLFLLLGGESMDHGNDSSLSRENAQLGYWEIGVGNAESLVETNAERIDSEHIASEAALVASLMAELEQYRYQDSVLITSDHESVCYLRRRLVASTGEEMASLRGFGHVILEEQLAQYFGQELQDYDFARSSRTPPRRTETDPEQVVSNGDARKFWELWRQVFRLLPTSALTGKQL